MFWQGKKFEQQIDAAICFEEKVLRFLRKMELLGTFRTFWGKRLPMHKTEPEFVIWEIFHKDKSVDRNV